ncbi:MAG: hypothetical protein HW388_662 [Dehalococcoidia bacterium]|nr:hypothetical protein [Dehalococcoidia bacterium]
MPEVQDKVAAVVGQKVRIEVTSWLTRYVGGDGSGRVYFDQEFAPGESLKAVLHRFGQRLPELDRVLWDPESGDLWEYVEIIVNDAFLGINHTMDSEVRDGDRITLMEAFEGG